MYCGKLTQTGIERIAFHSHDHSVKWEHAVNKLLAALFKTFHARYVLWRWERETQRCAAHREPAPERPPQHVFDTSVSLSENAGVRSLVSRMLRDDSLCWPGPDIVRDEDTKRGTRQTWRNSVLRTSQSTPRQMMPGLRRGGKSPSPARQRPMKASEG